MNIPADVSHRYPHVLLAGASGYIGRAVASRLLSDGYKVTAVMRDGANAAAGCSVVQANLTDAAELRDALAMTQADAVVSCIASRTGVAADAWRVDYEANRNLLAAAKDAQHFTLLSAICVQRPQLAFQHAKLRFETELKTAGIDYSIVRPTAFFKSLSGQIERLQRGKPFLVFGDGTQTACKPIGEQDLARFIVATLSDPKARNSVMPIGGPGEAITPREQGEMLFALLGQTPRFKSVPSGFLKSVAALLSLPGKLIPAAARKAELARIGHYYATESMLLWDAERQRYDADATPGTGSVTLRDHYERVLREGLSGQELGDQKLF